MDTILMKGNIEDYTTMTQQSAKWILLHSTVSENK